MTRKILITLSLLLLLVSSSVVACSTQTQPTTTTTTTTPTTSAKAQEWRYIITNTNLNAFCDAETQKAWDIVKQRTKGLLSITTVPNGSLPIAANDQLRAVGGGQIEMCLGNGAYHVGDFPLFGPLYTPYLMNNQEEKARVWRAVRPILDRELSKMNVHALAYIPYAEAGLFTKTPVDNIMNLKGMKSRSVGKDVETWVRAVGGTPIEVAWAEVYTALQTGLVENVLTSYDGFAGIKGYEICKYAYNTAWSVPMWIIVVNKAKWDSTPSDQQVIVMETLSDTMTQIQSTMESNVQYWVNYMMKNGLKSYEPTVPSGWFDLMHEKVTKARLAESLPKAGSAGIEMIEAIEKALGRSVR